MAAGDKQTEQPGNGSRTSRLARAASLVLAGMVGGALTLGALWWWSDGQIDFEGRDGSATASPGRDARLDALETEIAVLTGRTATATSRPVLPTMTLRIAARGLPSSTPTRAERTASPTPMPTDTATATRPPSVTPTPSVTLTPRPTPTPSLEATSRPTATLRILH